MAVPSPSKVHMRTQALEQRRSYARSLEPALRRDLEAKLAQFVLPHLIGARIVAGYHPMKDEISPYAVLDLLEDNQVSALPWFLDRDARMLFRKAPAVEVGPWGVLQPSSEAEALAPDVVWAQLNWRAVPFAHAVQSAFPELPFVWTFKESPQRSVVRGEWPLLAELVTRASASLFATEEERDWFALALSGRVDPGWLGVLDGDLPKRDWLDAPLSPRLSDRDGQPHTVVAGRPAGLDLDWVLGLAARGVHTHLYGQVRAPGPKGSWTAWLDAALAAAPGFVHVHPAVGPEEWVTELSRYDAGWLHRFDSANGGDLRRASWDDLNSPARLPVYLAAGLPLLQQANPGSLVSVERVLRRDGTGLSYRSADEVADVLAGELASRRGSAAALAVREQHTFDAHADRVVELFRRVAG